MYYVISIVRDNEMMSFYNYYLLLVDEKELVEFCGLRSFFE